MFSFTNPSPTIQPVAQRCTTELSWLLSKECLHMYREGAREFKSMTMTMAAHVARIGEMRITYNILIGKLEWKRPLGRPSRRWENNIRMNLRE
jgi:hypothetical protein